MHADIYYKKWSSTLQLTLTVRDVAATAAVVC